MNKWRYITRSLSHYRWPHLAVILAVAVTSAVLTGALLVGDSVRGSLRDLSLERLGKIDFALITDRFFREDLVDELIANHDFSNLASDAIPACIVGKVTIERRETDSGISRAGNITLIGCDQRFWDLDVTGLKPEVLPEKGEVVLNQNLAAAINAQVGDTVVLRLPDANQVPADSPLGRQEGRINSLPSQKVVAILPNQGLARFSLFPSQQYANNAFVSIETVQDAVDQSGRLNAILATANPTDSLSAPETATKLNNVIQPKLTDYGISVSQNKMDFPSNSGTPVWNYYHFTSDQLIWNDEERQAVLDEFSTPRPQELLTYLATRIGKSKPREDDEERAKAGIPYSTVLAVDNDSTLGPLVDENGQSIAPLKPGQIALSNWSAEQLNVELGDEITLTFFEPETTHGKSIEQSASFNLAAIVPITQPRTKYRHTRKPVFAARPTLANDAGLTPTVEGITDQDSIDDWDPPFPFDQSRVKDPDDEYWDYHRTTPKAYISLADGKKIWASRFGQATSFRLPFAEGQESGALQTKLARALQSRNSALGFRFEPVKHTSLVASKSTTPFEFLFIGFSFFLIASALMLVAILFRLTVELRAGSLGTLMAGGWDSKTLRNVTISELAIVAIVGSAVGVLGGLAYAALMLAGLRNLWVAAVVTPFLRLHITPLSLILGFLITSVIAILVVWFSLRRLGESTITDLLSGRIESAIQPGKKNFRGWLPPALLVFAAILALVATQLSGEAQAGCFFGGGAMVLTAALLWIRATMYRQGSTAASRDRLSPVGLAWRSATRNPGRSALTMGLMAAATFLIIAIAAFRLAPTASGTGGFELIANSDRPLYIDFRDDQQVDDAFGSQRETILASTIVPLRVQQGDDASCRNLYQATRPTLLGVSPAAIQQFESLEDDFAWSGGDWAAIGEGSETDDIVPVVIDKNTAMYSLHLPPTIGYEFTLEYEPPIRFRIAGILSNTTLQGTLIVPESSLVKRFPQNSGFQKFLIRTDDPTETSNLLEERFGDEGLDVIRSEDVLRDLLAVQNTYLSTFQSLGALGLLLGTLGLAAVQVRNVLTRRGELALFSAIGFSPSAVRRQLIWENASLLLAGLCIGTIAALVVVVPQALFGDATLPLSPIVMTLFAILTIGLLAGMLTSRFALQTPILAALRDE